MGYELSPAVERASVAAREWASRLGSETVRLAHWLLGLIEDEDGKPATLLRGVGADPEAIRATLLADAQSSPVAPPEAALLAAGREKAIALRGDPTLTTDFVLLAVLDADAAFRDRLAGLGVEIPVMEAVLAPDRADRFADAEPGAIFSVTEPAELSDAGRVVDVNLNRAREALRVLDDYCRFVLNDRVLTAEVKTLRHELVEAATELPSAALLSARDTVGDVGTSITTARESVRQSPADVATVNLKRLQEALRSIEEFGKVFGARFSRRVEAIRYRVYTLERAVRLGGAARARLADARLYMLLTASQCTAALDWTIAEAAAGGVSIFQLREKNLTDRELLARAREVRRWTRQAGALFIVNDRPDIARLSEADGVHLGQEDLPVAAARHLLGPDALIGVSTHTPEQVRRAVLDGADYLGVGPAFPSRTKEFAHFPGLDFVREAVEATSLPAFVLGGIDAATIGRAIEAGARRAAVGAALACADDPRATARHLLARLRTAD
jgi:thiamine-phosphate pyrophosphorylase